MMKKSLLCLLLLLVALSFQAFAFQGKVTGIDDKVVTLSVEKQLPSWVQKGALAETSGGLAKVESVDGQTFGVKVKKSTADKLKVGDELEVAPKSSGAGKKLQGC